MSLRELRYLWSLMTVDRYSKMVNTILIMFIEACGSSLLFSQFFYYKSTRQYKFYSKEVWHNSSTILR